MCRVEIKISITDFTEKHQGLHLNVKPNVQINGRECKPPLESSDCLVATHLKSVPSAEGTFKICNHLYFYHGVYLVDDDGAATLCGCATHEN